MNKSACQPTVKEEGSTIRNRSASYNSPHRRTQSASPVVIRVKSPVRKPLGSCGVRQRRCQSLSPINQVPRQCTLESPEYAQGTISESGNIEELNYSSPTRVEQGNARDKDVQLPQCLLIKTLRNLSSKKREFMKLRKNLIAQQNTLLEQYAALKEMEARAGAPADGSLGEVRVLSLSGWPAHDLLMLVRDDLAMPVNSEICGVFGPQVLQQLLSQLNPIPEEVLAVGAEIMASRIDLLNLWRSKTRSERPAYLTNLEWKAKNTEFDHETEKLHNLVAGTAENLKAKITYSLELAKIPWLDRDGLMKKAERLQKENLIYQHKLEEYVKKDENDIKETGKSIDIGSHSETVYDELNKERAAREALKEAVSSAEGSLRLARARITTLERQLKDNKADLEGARRKQKELEQLVKQLNNSHQPYRHREESSFDVRSKKLIEASKTGEITVEVLSHLRDSLELRVKELREQVENAEKFVESREAEQRAMTETLHAKLTEQERKKEAADARVVELEARLREMEESLYNMRERSGRLIDMERGRCLDYVPSKENEPSDRETEIWKELQVTRLALSRAEEELRLSRADKDNFLNSLSRIAQDGVDNIQDKMAAELLEREQKIRRLKHIVSEQKENEKLMEQTMTEYENQLASLRLEVKRLRNFDVYSKEIPFQDMQTELLELQMQVDTLTRERAALVTAAASRALMLERHERAADLFTKVTRARRDLAALLDGRSEPPATEIISHAEMTQSLSSVCAHAADTWTALRAERARVLRLESAVLAQSLQLEREGRVRTQLERRRALLERELYRAHSAGVSDTRSSRVYSSNARASCACSSSAAPCSSASCAAPTQRV